MNHLLPVAVVSRHLNAVPSFCLSARPSVVCRPTQAVFFHIATNPIRLLTVPAIPTMPSSRLTQPSAEVGMVRSHKSEMSCNWLADRSL